MDDMHNVIKRYYGWGLFAKTNLQDFVKNTDWLTAEQYNDITGEDYNA